jgi:hypothetical protein
MTDTQIFEPDGRAIAYAAEGEGPALVLITDRGSDINVLGSLAHSVSQEDFRVIRIGVRADASTHDLAQDAIDVMNHLDIADAWVGGDRDVGGGPQFEVTRLAVPAEAGLEG